jgi:CRISPR/Cas system-associated exonuclease Cas4 (RecB family)
MSRSLLPQIVRLTPSNYSDFLWCPRLFYIGTLLGVPASDTPFRSADQGLLVHDVLERVHRAGSCRDDTNVKAALTHFDADTPQMRGFVERHSKRCPQEFERDAHEVDRVRFHREPPPMFLATARIDAVWIHDGVLDVRDYKTGAGREQALSEDARAKVQAWVMARDARRTGLRLQLRYEYLQPETDEDPEPWEPDDDDLARIDDELRRAVDQMWEEEEWRGVNEPDACSKCRFRSVCRDSATPGEAQWPVLSEAEEDPPRL